MFLKNIYKKGFVGLVGLGLHMGFVVKKEKVCNITRATALTTVYSLTLTIPQLPCADTEETRLVYGETL